MESMIIPLIYPIFIMFIGFYVFVAFIEAFATIIDLVASVF